MDKVQVEVFAVYYPKLIHFGDPKIFYSQEEINLYFVIKLATEISLFSLQISKT